SPFKRAARTVLLGGKDPLFDRVAVRELPARAVHRVRNFEDSVCSIGVKTTKTVLSQNLGMLVRKPLRFLITKTDNETISKSAIALLTGVNALAATLSICVYGVIPELFLDTIKVWAVANLIVSAFILTRKNMARFREMAEPEIDELARSTIAMVKES
ncbi:hypothetical protein J4450_04865, partial [Candidatus Micrarchaeota archaeon]|nr:hypothetical protein [Candidatus Micrarchaeota archaeon]